MEQHSAQLKSYDSNGTTPQQKHFTQQQQGQPRAISSSPAPKQSYFTNLIKVYGFKLLFLIFSGVHLLKGFTRQFTNAALEYGMRRHNVAAPDLQIYQTVIHAPWSIKPLMGLVSDFYPIRGKNKTYYSIITLILCLAALLGNSIDWAEFETGNIPFCTPHPSSNEDTALGNNCVSSVVSSKGSKIDVKNNEWSDSHKKSSWQ